jgi:hypothetical protein
MQSQISWLGKNFSRKKFNGLSPRHSPPRRGRRALKFGGNQGDQKSWRKKIVQNVAQHGFFVKINP